MPPAATEETAALALARITPLPLPELHPPKPGASTPPTAPATDAHRPSAAGDGVKVLPAPAVLSAARTPREYRHDGAHHLYRKLPDRIFIGKLPHLLFAVGVINIDIDARGEVAGIHWARPPRNAPRVMGEIENLVRAAAPYPAPVHMGGVTYTDTWLWDKSGRFQLDTLTQGQE